MPILINHVAKDLFLKSLQANRQLREFATMQFSYSGLCDISRYDNDFKRALEYADSSRAMHDSIYSFESREQILKIQLKNEFEQQHLADSLKHIQIVQKGYYELQRPKIVVNTSFLICLAVIFLGIISQRYRSVRKHAEQQSQIARQLLEIELKALRAQMNPHFVFNCLNSIQAFILRENKLEATEYLQKFSDLSD